MLRSASLLILLAALACTRSAPQGDVEPLAPGFAATPIERCVDNALAASSLVDESFAPKHQWGPTGRTTRVRRVQIMNPPGPRIRTLSFAVESPNGTPRSLVVEYFSPRQGGMLPAADPNLAELERQAVGEIAAQLLREVRAECMPRAVPQPTCVTLSQSSTGRCTIGM